jgi:hypothetical protein
MLTLSDGWSRIVTVSHHLLLFVKLVQCQLVFGFSFHVVTQSRVVTLFANCDSAFFLTSVTLLDVSFQMFSRLVTLGHELSLFATLLYCLLSWFSVISYLVALFTLSRIFRRSHVLSCFIRMVTPCIFSHVCYFFNFPKV